MLCTESVLSIGLDTRFTDPVACVETLGQRLSGSGGGKWQRLQRPGPCPGSGQALLRLSGSGGACSGQALLRLSGSGGACSGQALALQRFRVSFLLPADAGKARIATRDAAHRAAPAAAAAQQQLL